MLYVRKLFKQDLRGGKQIAFPTEPSVSFFNFDFRESLPARQISFKFKVKEGAQYYSLNNTNITTRLYSANSESRIDGELKAFLRDHLNAQIDDIVVFRSKKQAEFEFEFYPQNDVNYNFLLDLTNSSNHTIGISTITSEDKALTIDLLSGIARQKIIYGAPGTGKSYELQRQVTEDLKIPEANTKRVTFHPNYSYQQFVGTYKPTPIYKELEVDTKLFDSSKTIISLKENERHKEPIIDYTFVPGPFLSQLIEAMQEENREKPYMLIIEEINRASVASVFGDVFQLLDRDKNGTSEYEIEFNTDVTNYLKSKGVTERSIRIPNNLFIWATMNSADQGVMPLDSAFKRRWSFEYLELDKKEDVVSELSVKFLGQEYSWNKFRKSLNDKLTSLSVPEDKLIGPFFLKESELKDDNSIKNKLLIYLRDDVVRHNPETLFTKKTFSGIIKEYDADRNVFVDLNLSDAIFSETAADTEEDSESE